MSAPGQDLLGDGVGDYVAWALNKGMYPRFAEKFFGKTGDVSNLSGAINFTYGAIVYDHVNREANAHSILKKNPWERHGFRVTTDDPSTKVFGGADPGTVGSVVDTSPTELDTIPGFIHSPFDLTMDAGFRAQHDDGLDVWEWKLAIMRDIHAQGLNEQLLIDAENQAANTDGDTTDAKNESDTGNLDGSQDTDPVGLESLDRLIASDAEEDDVGGTNTGWYDIYEGDIDRDSSTTFDSVVVRPDGSKDTFGTDLNFQIAGLDTLIDDTEANGADPTAHVFLTNRTSRRAFYDELGSQGRFDLTQVETKLDMNGLSVSATHPGRDVTFTQRAYQDRPIVADKNVPTDANSMGRWYLIDQRHAHMKVGFPTLYVDVDNPVIRGQFDTKALYLTAEQTYMTRFNTSGKLRSQK